MITFEKLEEFGLIYSKLRFFLENNFNDWLDLINRKYYLENNHDKYSVYNQGYENYSPNSNDFLRIDSVGYNPKGFLTICLTFFKEGCCCFVIIWQILTHMVLLHLLL
jgi:hypothetical protein